jgi:tetratricopeptide (TPR) repeat protein
MRDAKRRNDAWVPLANALAGKGKWRESLEFAKLKKRDKMDGTPEDDVMRALAGTGRREWVQQAAPALAPADEALWLAQVEIQAGNLAAAREQALRIQNVERRLTTLEAVGQEADARENWDELAATARLIPRMPRNSADDYPGIHREIAAEWLIKAGALDEARALLPKLGRDEQEEKRAQIASVQARRGDYRGATAALPSLHPDFHPGVKAAIAIGKVMRGDAKLDEAMATIVDRDRRMDALQTLGDELPEARRDEARAALRQAVQLAQGPYVEDRAIVLGNLASLQARRGFFDDALQTALLVKNTEELLGAYGDIGIAQASKGLTDDARKTFVIAEGQARKHLFTGENHAWLTQSIANAGLLPEAYAQVAGHVPTGSWRVLVQRGYGCAHPQARGGRTIAARLRDRGHAHRARLRRPSLLPRDCQRTFGRRHTHPPVGQPAPQPFHGPELVPRQPPLAERHLDEEEDADRQREIQRVAHLAPESETQP